MALVAATMPSPTDEYVALEPRDGEDPLDALARVGDGIVTDAGGSDTRDTRKNKKLPRQLAALVALRAQGFDNVEIAERLRVSPQKLRALVAKARKEYGWSDLGDQIAHVAVPQAVANVIKHLEYEGSAAGVLRNESTMTRATLAGTGMFKTHSAVKQESESRQTNILRVEIALPELPPGQALAAIDGVLATPRRARLCESVPAASVVTVTEPGG